MRTFLFLLILAAVTNTATGTTKGKGKRGKRGNGSDSNICKNLTYEQQLETTDKWIGLWFTCTRNGGSRYAYNPLSDEEPLWHTLVVSGVTGAVKTTKSDFERRSCKEGENVAFPQDAS
ncbi:hypothetical protein ScalyP_jg3668, partial [Parmales sp. scaly parma]